MDMKTKYKEKSFDYYVVKGFFISYFLVYLIYIALDKILN